jgi:glycosyltransferase involved in cell wall biosynthesis
MRPPPPGRSELGERSARVPRFLVFAYACEPDKGSEPGAGWIWSRMIARIGETWVITRENNRPSIEEALPSIPERENLRFIYVDLPERARFWKRRNRGARLYYLLWQAAALSRAREMHRDVPFDAVWHLTWANAWIGSMAPLLPVPFVYGPVAGGVSMPWRLAPALGIRGFIYEVARAIARTGARYVNPLARLSWRRARLILVQNPETREWLPRRHREKVVIFPNVVLDHEPQVGDRSPPRPPFTALFAGRLLPLKGLALALRVMRSMPDWRLVICGHGPDEPRLRRLAKRLGVEDRVEFRGLVTREEVYSRMRRSDVFLFPSLHDEGGFVVAEAIAEGLPVVCLAWGGPPVIGGTAVHPATVSATVAALVAAVGEAPGSASGSFPTIDGRTEALRALLDATFPSWSLLTPVGAGTVVEVPGQER